MIGLAVRPTLDMEYDNPGGKVVGGPERVKSRPIGGNEAPLEE